MIVNKQQEWAKVANARRLVVKIGSNLLTERAGVGESLRLDWIEARCREIAALVKEGRQVVVVTSGSVAAGTPRLNLGRRPRTVPEKQAAAAAGQGVLMRAYDEFLQTQGLHAAQVLLTRDDANHRRRYLNARDTLTTLLNQGLVPVVNENDTVVTAELRFGDNDTLAANVADLVDADLLILLSDVAGLYDADPRKNPDAEPIPLVEAVTPEIEALAGGAGSSVGTGGMETKLKAAKKAARFGCRTVLSSGFVDAPIRAVLDEHRGTLFLPDANPLNSRKRWIINARSGEGALTLDDGAAAALSRGKSLLAKGIVSVEGTFDRGDAVLCRNRAGGVLAKGLVNYESGHLKRVAGKHSREFESILGFIADEEIIHRDDLVMMSEADGHD